MSFGKNVQKAITSVSSTLGVSPKQPAQAAQKVPQKINDPALVQKAYALYKEFKSAYTAEHARIKKCELYYNTKHWDEVPKNDDNEPRPVTPSLHSANESSQAEFLDRFPQATILPQTEEDKDVAEIVSALVQKNHDSSHYKKEYGHLVHDLLTSGYCVQEVGYDVHANRGLGGAFIRYVDVYNMLFDPLASEDINDGRACFKTIPRTIEYLEQTYPQYKGQFVPDSEIESRDNVLTFDSTKCALELEYWYREFDPLMYEGVGGFKVHMAKLAGQQVLGNSMIQRPQGYFPDGEYPFVVTYLFERKGTPLGYGMVDVHGDQQLMADKLDQQVAINAVAASKLRMLVTDASGFEVDELRDFKKSVLKGTSLNGVTWFPTPPLPEYLLVHIAEKRQNMSDTSGANDVSQGNVASGVTSFKAIDSLQSASNKRTRTVSDRMMEDFKRCVEKEIEAERTFNLLPREVLLKRDGKQTRAVFDSKNLTRVAESGEEVPIEFEISIKVEVENKWSTALHNNTVLEAVKEGILTPEQGFELMIIEGKEAILAKIKENPPTPDPAQLQAQQQEQQAQQAADQASQQQDQLAGQLQQMQSPDAVLA